MALNARSPPRRRAALATGTLVALLVVVAAVSVGVTAAYYELKPAPATGGAGTVTVVDDLGRTVTAPTDAGRIVALAPSLMDIVFRLGLRDRVVAVGCSPTLEGGIYNEYSPNQTALWGLSNASCLADFPSLNTEGVANDSPDLVLASTLTSQAAVDQLTVTYHLPVVLLAPSTIGGILGDVRIVSALFPASATSSTALEAQLEGILASAAALDQNLSSANASNPTVLLAYYFDAGGYYTYGAGSFGASLLDVAGGANLAAGVPLLYAEINATVVLNDQPAILIYGTSWNDPHLVSGQTPDVWPTAPYWGSLTAQKIPIEVTLLTEPGPSMILELPTLEHWLHPDVVPAPGS